MREGNNLKQFAHCGAIMPDQAGERLVDIGSMRGVGPEGGRPLFDTELPQKLRLIDGSEAGNAHGLDRSYQCLEIHVCSEVEIASICQRVGESVLADGLQGLAEAAFDMAIVDDERRASTVGDAAAQLYRLIVASPFKDCAGARRAQSGRQQ